MNREPGIRNDSARATGWALERAVHSPFSVFCSLNLHSIAILALLPACVGISTLQGPEPLGKHKWEIGIESSAQGAAGASGSTVYPIIDGSFRYGLTDALDVGGRAGANGVGAFTKVFIGRSLDGRLALALLPQLSGGYLTLGGKRSSFVHLDVPVLLGLHLNQRWQAIAAPRFTQTLAMAHRTRGTAADHVFSTGGTVGVQWHVSKSLKLLPEIGLLVPLTGQGANSDAGGGNINVPGADLLFQVSLGVLMSPN